MWGTGLVLALLAATDAKYFTLCELRLYIIGKWLLPRRRKVLYDRPEGVNRVPYDRPNGVLPVKLVSQPLILFLLLLLDFHFQGFLKRRSWL